MESIPSTKPVAPWVGGKRNLAKRLCQLIDQDKSHLTYAEPFFGMGGVFLRREQRPQAEFINDANRDVYNLFRILQEHYAAFLDYLRYQITTQANFERLVQVDPESLTEIQRAARFLYLQRTGFGGKAVQRNFGIGADRPARFNLTTLEPDLAALHDRLASVTVLNSDYSRFIVRCDRPETLFYLDPPYWGTEDYYGKTLFSRDDFTVLADLLKVVRGRFLLTINDLPETREVFREFRQCSVDTVYTFNAKRGGKKSGEIIVSNYELPKS